MGLGVANAITIARCLIKGLQFRDSVYHMLRWTASLNSKMQTPARSFHGCGMALTQRRALVVPALSPTLRTYLLTQQQISGATLSASGRRPQYVLLTAHTSDVSSFTTIANCDIGCSDQKESNAPLPAHPDDILLVPAAHLHTKRLERHGISTLAKFHQVYQRERETFRRFLQDKIGVQDAEHLAAMEAFFRALDLVKAPPSASATLCPVDRTAGPLVGTGTQMAAPEAAAASPPTTMPLGATCEQVTLSVEGNISAGKSTFLSILHRHLLTDKGFSFVKEPIEQWQNVGGSSVNLLELFYREPARMAYTFQNFVFLTRVLQERETYGNTGRARLLERSVFSDRMVFVRAVHASRDLSDHELAIFDAWFGPVLASLPTLVPNGLIYLRASPETCMARLKKRARCEEGGIPLEYLQCLHKNHEDWLLHAATRAIELKQRLRQQQQQEDQQQRQSPLNNSGYGDFPQKEMAEEEEAMMAARRRSSYETTSSSPSSSLSSFSRDPITSPPAGHWDGVLGDLEQQQQQRQRQRLPPLAGLRPLWEAPPLALSLVDIPDRLAASLYIIDATKVSGVPSVGFLHQLPALLVDCDTDIDVDGDEEYGREISNLVRDYTTFVSQYRAACHRLAAERRHRRRRRATSCARLDLDSLASGPCWDSDLGTDSPLLDMGSIPATGGGSLSHPATDYYTTDAEGRVTYRPVVPDVPGGVAMGAVTQATTMAPVKPPPSLKQQQRQQQQQPQSVGS